MKLNKQTATWRQQRVLFIENLSIGMCLYDRVAVKRSIFFLVILSVRCSHMISLWLSDKGIPSIMLCENTTWIPEKVLLFIMLISML